METKNFYITLPSNVKKVSSEQAGNSIGNYITRLNQRLNLSEDWMVALTDISYTKSWYNIPYDQELSYVDSVMNPNELNIKLPAGNYGNIKDIIAKINNIYSDFFNDLSKNSKYSKEKIVPPYLGYDATTNKVLIVLGESSYEKSYIYPVFSTFLANFLGLQDPSNKQYPYIKDYKIPQFYKKIIPPEKEVEDYDKDYAEKTAQKITPIISTTEFSKPVKPDLKPLEAKDVAKKIGKVFTNTFKIKKISSVQFPQSDQPYHYINEGTLEGISEVLINGTIQSLYVYTSIVKPSLVGDTEAQLLRRVEVPTDKAFGETCVINYHNPHYHDLVTHEFDRIEIDIKDDTNQTVEFAFGRTEITLHFKKKTNNVFESIYKLLR